MLSVLAINSNKICKEIGMLYDSDDYLNGLDHSVHKNVEYCYKNVCLFSLMDYEPTAFPGHYISAASYSLECILKNNCSIDNPYCYPNPYLPGNNHYPPEPEIAKLWHIAKEECNIIEKIDKHPVSDCLIERFGRVGKLGILPNNTCLNDRFGRTDEPVGEEKCSTYYFWRLEVKSRACMIKNAKLEEFDVYEICGKYDDAFLCTKDSIIYKQKLQK